MTYLVDANVICEPSKSRASADVCHWLDENVADIVIDAVVLGESWQGITALPSGRQRRELEDWFGELRVTIKCLDWTDDTAVVWGDLREGVRRAGFTVGVPDTMIAASAKLHGLTVATRNVDDFTRCGVPVVNPFA